MVDPFGRMVDYLRISVTDRCDFRCVYCMSEDMNFLPKKELLTIEELTRVSNAFIRLGVKKLRFTGGEPLVRKNIMALFNNLTPQLESGALREMTLTTNGSQLGKYAQQLADAGMRRINVSLDTLNSDKFTAITRWGKFDQVMEGLQAAKKAGLKVKINTVALQGVNDDELHTLVSWCGDEGFDLTFIEVMPMGDIGNEDRVDQYLPLTKVRSLLSERWSLNEIDYKTGGPARYVEVRETGGKIGFITPMTHNFCESCNRVRMTCTGTLYLCLGQDDAMDLRAPLRSSDSDEPLEQAIFKAIARKPKGHDFIIDRDTLPSVARHMSVTGG
ncbi:GTP 3',8-cyclase MoaA [Kiloniella laminariae]|uniref:GTP 3',8-cyclase n=1 Tax=Kiloniella laminariae TaxID=454162 RepID=A0ABT4LHK7_9PROT|nr:GTP 3',8-cyclase MoaA [Kiloniella laminariae]MCZ4280580.1 GTP 3',8-cyclase MoaA [Kiloniella laminariae]